MQRLFLAGIIKNEYQKEYLAEMDKEGVLYYEYLQPKWLDKAPDFLKSYFESWGSYTIELSSGRLALISCLKELSYFENIKALDIHESDSYEAFIHAETIEIFKALSKIKNIEELSIELDYLTPNSLKLIRHFKLTSLSFRVDSLDDGGLEVISSIKSLKKLECYTSNTFPYKELVFLNKLKLNSFSLYWGAIVSGGTGLTSIPILDYFKYSESLNDINITVSLTAFLKHLHNFPNVKTLSLADYSVSTDQELITLTKIQGIEFTYLYIDSGVSVNELMNLSKIKSLESLSFSSSHHNLSDVDFSSFKSLKYLQFPDYFNLKEFLKSKQNYIKFKSIFCPGTLIDLETAKLIKASGISEIIEEENSLSNEVSKFFENNGILILHKKLKSLQRKRTLHQIASNQKGLTYIQEIKKAKEEGTKSFSCSFDQFTKNDADLLLSLNKLERLHIDLDSGMENLNYLNQHKSLKSLDLIFESPPKKAITFENLEKLELMPRCGLSFKKHFDTEKFTNLKTLKIHVNDDVEICDLSGVEIIKSLKELDLYGQYSFEGSDSKIHLEKLNYSANACGILSNILPSDQAKDYNITFFYNNSPEHFKALKAYSDRITNLHLSEAILNANDYDLFSNFTNLESLSLPYSQKQINLKTLRAILKLPKLGYLDIGSQKLLKEEYDLLTEEEKAKLE